MNDAERALRGEIVRTCLAMGDKRINQGTSGNVSVRHGKGMLITPSGLAYETMSAEDIVFVAMDGTADGAHVPSTEWRFHRDILRERGDINAIVHAHPIHSTALSMLNKDIPAAHYMIAAMGGPTVRCARYATYGTQALSAAALEALEDRTACLLANHGMIACGPNLPKALWLAVELEVLAHQYAVALSAGDPVILPDAEIADVKERFKSYGPRPKAQPQAQVEAPAQPKAKAKAPPPSKRSMRRIASRQRAKARG